MDNTYSIRTSITLVEDSKMLRETAKATQRTFKSFSGLSKDVGSVHGRTASKQSVKEINAMFKEKRHAHS